MDIRFLLLTMCVVVHTVHSHPPPRNGINIANDDAGLKEKRTEVLERLEKVLKQLLQEELQQVNAAQHGLQNSKAESGATGKLSVDEALKSTQELSDTDLSEVLKADDDGQVASQAHKQNSQLCCRCYIAVPRGCTCCV
ncbi:uncharacterized protein LOC135810818 [Sycon ciliatum]|uniref:uncharacterized protein LOC135810818 n=1 Tax=Sycon ciliatum TaxID=27933 RepID=UPI0031F66F02